MGPPGAETGKKDLTNQGAEGPFCSVTLPLCANDGPALVVDVAYHERTFSTRC